MFNLIKNNNLIRLILFSLLCFLAGGLNGFLGTGAGILFVFALSIFTPVKRRDALATTLCATLPISLISSIPYLRNGNIDFSLTSRILIPCAIGGIVGALITDKIKTSYLNTVFSLLLIYSGFSFLLR